MKWWTKAQNLGLKEKLTLYEISDGFDDDVPRDGLHTHFQTGRTLRFESEQELNEYLAVMNEVFPKKV